MADRMSGRSQLGYSCNLELVGQHVGEGAGWQMAWYDDCAYYGTAGNENQTSPGVVVVDVSDPTNPVQSANLDSISLIDPWESLKVNEARGLLAGVNAPGGSGGPELDIYDLTQDCSQPVLLSSTAPMPAATGESSQVGHAGGFSADGMTYFGTTILQRIHAIDISDPTTPVLLTEHTIPVHDLSTSPDGNRTYVAQLSLAAGGDGFAILDSSLVQSRATAPQFVPLGTIAWEEGTVAQGTQYFEVGGNPYVLVTQELGSSGITDRMSSCDAGLAPHGTVRIIDVSIEAAPQILSTVRLEINLPENCEMTVMETQGTGLFAYDSHYCTVDDPTEATVMGCAFFQSGLRIFDIRDPANPAEIAYYNPPANPNEALVGSHRNFDSAPAMQTADWAGSNVRFIPERGEVWFTSMDNGFQVLRFKDGVWPFE